MLLSKIAKGAAASVICLFSLASASAAHAALIGVASNPTGGLQYEGFGETSAGSGIGSGRLTLGDCAFDGVNTTCTISGTYEESADSGNAPGATGEFIFQLIYGGDGPAPTLAQSVAPGDDQLVFFDIGVALFTIELFPSTGGVITGQFPADPFSDSIGFSSFTGPDAMCSGLGAGQACSIGQVGLVAGAVLNASISPFVFSIPENVFDPTPIPAPAGLLLMATGLVFLRRKAKNKRPH